MSEDQGEFRRRLLAGHPVFGIFLNLGSPVAAEISARAGLDWVLTDLEHGMGHFDRLLHQLIAVSGTGAVPFVRIPLLRQEYFKRVLDFVERDPTCTWI